jgi:beta-lactamase class A
MLETMRKLVLGDALSPQSRKQLVTWLAACKTGGKRLRAGIPTTWRAGDKTGSGGRNGADDIAVFFPSKRAAIVVTAYYMESRAAAPQRNGVLAEVGKLAARV